jgi:hypothetical protein
MDEELEEFETVDFLITAEICIPKDMIDDETDVIKCLVDQSIKIKSGVYENMAFGYVISAIPKPNK